MIEMSVGADIFDTTTKFVMVSKNARASILRYIVGLWLVEMAISTNQKPTIYCNLYKNTGPASYKKTETGND